jgi:hypothetical protein
MELRKAQIENILKICTCADMIRCDMAHLILNDFINTVRKKKSLKKYSLLIDDF